MPTYRFRLNGRQTSVDTWDPNEPLLYALRDSLGMHGLSKRGGGQGIGGWDPRRITVFRSTDPF